MDNELSHLKSQMLNLSREEEIAHRSLNEHQREIDEIKSQIFDVQDSVFDGFCKLHNFDNIRSFEARRFKHETQDREDRAAFNTQKAKLSSL